MSNKEKILWFVFAVGMIALLVWGGSQKEQLRGQKAVGENIKKEAALNYLKNLKKQDSDLIIEQEKKYPIQCGVLMFIW